MDYARVYSEFITDRRCKENNLSLFETHHVLPRHLKGTNAPENLIRLSLGDHLFAHILLGHVHGGVLATCVVRMLGMKKYAGRHSRAKFVYLRVQHRKAVSGKRSPEVCAKIGRGHKGKVVSDETRAKLSAARKHQIISSEHAAAISRANMGNRHGLNPSPETRKKISDGAKGKQKRLGAVLSPETRELIRQGQLAHQARKRANRNEHVNG